MLLYTPFRKTKYSPLKRNQYERFVLQCYRTPIQTNGSWSYILIAAWLLSRDTPGVDVLDIRP